MRCHRHTSGLLPYRSAASELLKSTGTVFLLTGFYIKRFQTIETDGLTGTWLLATALEKLGFNPMIPFDQTTATVFRKIYPHHRLLHYPIADEIRSKLWAESLINQFNPVASIAIERPGPNKANRFLNANGDDVTDFIGRSEFLFPSSILTIGIGDGGNELGLTQIATIPSDYTLMGSTSDFAAFGLVTALEITTGQPLLPPECEIEKFILNLARQGIVDGLTGEIEASVDGYLIEAVLNKYQQFKDLAEKLKVMHTGIQQFKETLVKQYGSAVFPVIPRWNPETRRWLLQGKTLNKELIARFAKFQNLTMDDIEDNTRVLSDPDATFSETTWVKVSDETDLLDRPGGKTTTQIAEYDQWVRILWKDKDWILVQTPDLAMGWCQIVALDSSQKVAPKTNLWDSICRPVQGHQISKSLSLKIFEDLAGQLIGIPYFWGGRGLDGIDCSGLTQRLFYSQGILLPRNSRDQRKCGERVSVKSHCPGDLIFAVGRKKALHHVAIALEKGVQHACLSVGRVIIESLDDFDDKYRIIGVRRIAPVA